jgi:hypothetical protein
METEMRNVLFLLVFVSVFAVASCGGEEDFDCSSGVVFATKGELVKNCSSGLIWTKKAVSGKTYQEAEYYCQNLDLDGGNAGWRLPTVNDMQEMIKRIDGEEEDGDDDICMLQFPGLENEWFWTVPQWCEGCELANADYNECYDTELDEFCQEENITDCSGFQQDCLDEKYDVIMSSLKYSGSCTHTGKYVGFAVNNYASCVTSDYEDCNNGFGEWMPLNSSIYVRCVKGY